jgi:hypothetical protein
MGLSLCFGGQYPLHNSATRAYCRREESNRKHKTNKVGFGHVIILSAGRPERDLSADKLGPLLLSWAVGLGPGLYLLYISHLTNRVVA